MGSQMHMGTWFDVTLANGRTILKNAASATEAAAKVVADIESPVWCRIHDELPAERVTGRDGVMGFYHPPKASPVVAVTAMREVWQGGGYCVVPA